MCYHKIDHGIFKRRRSSPVINFESMELDGFNRAKWFIWMEGWGGLDETLVK